VSGLGGNLRGPVHVRRLGLTLETRLLFPGAVAIGGTGKEAKRLAVRPPGRSPRLIARARSPAWPVIERVGSM